MNWLPALALCLLPSLVHAQPLALDQLRDVRDLEHQVGLLHDPSAQLSLADVRARTFDDNAGRSLSLGFDFSALWLRFQVRNESARTVSWLLELAEPTLDHVDLYIVHPDGHTEHLQGGDSLPFAQRSLPHVSHVFELESPARREATYYVRVQSDEVLRAPLRAWLPDAYRREHDRDMLVHVVFLGALLLIAVYHVGVFAMVRQQEYAWFALVALSLAIVMMSLGGQVGQLFFPDQPRLADRFTSVSIAFAMVTVAFFTWATTERLGTVHELARQMLRTAYSLCGLLALACVLNTGVGLRLLCGLLFLLTVSGPIILYAVRKYRIPALSWYSLAWYALILSVPIAILRYAGLMPDDRFTQGALPVGFMAYCVINSLALAALANRLRSEIASTNQKLVHNVEQLQQALLHAEEANDNAVRATKAKDEFMATMSHELRTPLNTIINIPQGLAGEFVRERSARCAGCDAAYLLDEQDHVDADSLCEDCGSRGTLVEGSKVRYRGDGARALRFLHKIERSGQHLLQMVNGVLDYSKLEAGRFQLVFGPVDLEALLREVIEQTIDSAQRKRIDLVLVPQQGAQAPLSADGLRLKQVLVNLIANAIKFSPAHSVVTVRWTSQDDSELITVDDQGIGIAESDHERIFTSFEQVHKGDTRKYGGTGLGLSISRSLVRMHGGELYVRSALGKGATFTVRVPHAPRTALEKAS
ncbi:MAG TPA: sensor histidine kinase [Polyangiales bacterium]|nr:sensor histidine kinase [Polyangiales bacterium]